MGVQGQGGGQLRRSHAVLIGSRAASDNVETVAALLTLNSNGYGPFNILAAASLLDPATRSILRSPPDGVSVRIVPEFETPASLLHHLQQDLGPADSIIFLGSGERINGTALIEATDAFEKSSSVLLSVVGALVDEDEELVQTDGGPLSLIKGLRGELPISAFLFSGRALLNLDFNSIPKTTTALGAALLASVLKVSGEVAHLRGAWLYTSYRAWQNEMGIASDLAQSMLRKHNLSSFGRGAASLIEHRVAPRFALVELDTDSVRLLSDANLTGQVLTVNCFAERLARLAYFDATDLNVPEYLVFTTNRSTSAIKQSRLQAWFLNHVARTLQESSVSAYQISTSDGDISISRSELNSHFRIQKNDEEFAQVLPNDRINFSSSALDVIAIKTGLFIDIVIKGEISSFSKMISLPLSPDVVKTRIVTPFASNEPDLAFPAAGSDPVAVHARRLAIRVRQRLPPGIAQEDALRENKRTEHLDTARALARLFDTWDERLIRVLPTERLKVAFALPIISFGGVERVTIRVAERLRQLGVHTTLLVFDKHEIWSAREVAEAFDDIIFIGQVGSPRENLWAQGKTWRRAIALASESDILLVSYVHDWSALIRPLHEANVGIVPYLHATSYARDGGPVGQPYIATEAIPGAEGVIVISDHLFRWCGAQGFAEDRTLLVRNSSSHKFDPARIAQASHARQERMRNVPLRILYLGRLDPEKGLARLAEIARDVDAMSGQIDFRIVGAAVFGGELPPEIKARLHPPTFDTNKIADHYSWADVLLMTSSSEGVPLTILEAMQFGVVPISTNVGAIAEIVKDAIDGYLIDPSAKSVSDEIIQKIVLLRDDRDLLKRIGTNAAARSAGGMGWTEAGDAVNEFLMRLVTARRAKVE